MPASHLLLGPQRVLRQLEQLQELTKEWGTRYASESKFPFALCAGGVGMWIEDSQLERHKLMFLWCCSTVACTHRSSISPKTELRNADQDACENDALIAVGSSSFLALEVMLVILVAQTL